MMKLMEAAVGMNRIASGVARLLAASVALCCFSLPAQDTEAEKPPKKKDPPAEGKEPVKDPTKPSDRLKEILHPPEKPGAAAQPVVKVPEIKLKAYFEAAGKPGSAILEVGGKGLITVRENSLIQITGETGGTLTLTVKSVSSEGISIEVPGLKELLLVK
jgi:hypothetical protein